MRRAILESWREDDGDMTFATLKRGNIAAMLASMKTHAKKNWLKTIRGLMQFAVAAAMRADDPTQGINRLIVATPPGFEPGTFSLEGCCSIP